VGGTTLGDFLGTTDAQALELKVNGQRAFRLEPTTNSPNLIGGWSGNSVDAGVFGATINGGARIRRNRGSGFASSLHESA
jgi:hypothetical protein